MARSFCLALLSAGLLLAFTSCSKSETGDFGTTSKTGTGDLPGTTSLSGIISGDYMCGSPAPEGYDLGPKAGVTVTLLQGGSPVSGREAVITGADGAYRFGNIRPGSYRIGLSGEGYTPVTSEAFYVSEKPYTFDTGVFPLFVTGRVTDKRGNPVESFQVRVVSKANPADVGLQMANNGIYQMQWFSPGEYTIRAEAQGYRPSEPAEVTIAYGRTVYVDFELTPAD